MTTAPKSAIGLNRGLLRMPQSWSADCRQTQTAKIRIVPASSTKTDQLSVAPKASGAKKRRPNTPASTSESGEIVPRAREGESRGADGATVEAIYEAPSPGDFSTSRK